MPLSTLLLHVTSVSYNASSLPSLFHVLCAMYSQLINTFLYLVWYLWHVCCILAHSYGDSIMPNHVPQILRAHLWQQT